MALTPQLDFWTSWLQPWAAGLSLSGHAADSRLVQQRASALLQHAHAHSAFYRRHHGVEAGGRHAMPAWRDLPPVRKHELMAGFDDWVTDPALTLAGVNEFLADPSRIGSDHLGRYAVWTSSGTSGEPAIFVQDHAALTVYAALLASRMDHRCATGRWWTQAASGQHGLWGLAPRSALIAAIDGHYAGVSFWLRQGRERGGQSRTFPVSWPIERLCTELRAWQPAFVASYPSVLVELARQQEAGALKLAPLALWSGGEGLAASTRSWIETVFGAPVVNDYGASECLSIAFECRHGRLHLNDDWVVLEPIDAAGRPVPPGVASHSVLLTNLANKVQPLIRYQLGDSVTFYPDTCACGNARPSFSVEGRCDDTLRLSNGRHGVVHLSPMALTTAVEEGADVHRFQLCQTAADVIDLRIDTLTRPVPEAQQQRALQALRDFLVTQGLPEVQVRLDPQPPLLEQRSGKLRQVLCLV
jgi:phenylacetate-coenzyme A ligase PaaK-like adenylate-forming protein